MNNTGFFNYIYHDIFSALDGITYKKMFGGVGFYKNGIIFGMIAEGKLYFKVGIKNLKDFENRGMKPFTYIGHNGKEYSMSYWELPEDILENRQELPKWIEKAVLESRIPKKKASK